MRNLTLLMALLGGLSVARSATVVQTESIPLHTPDGNYSLVFDQFDDALGTLDAVEIVFTLSMYGGSVSVDNDSDQAVTATARIRADAGLSSSQSIPSLSIINLLTQVFELQPTTGDPIDEYNNTGDVDHARFDGPDSNNPNTVITSGSVSSGSLSEYVGTGTYTINVATESLSGASGGVQFVATLMQTYGDVEITYHYTPIPEPATAGLAGLGALLLLRRRRR